MAIDNHVDFSGNLTRDPELRFTLTGKAVANFAIAINRRWESADGETEEAVTFLDISCWGDLAENVTQSLTKGARVSVTGRLEENSWTTDDGDVRRRHQVTADDVAVSLKWATAKPVKTIREKSEPNQKAKAAAAAQSTEEPF